MRCLGHAFGFLASLVLGVTVASGQQSIPAVRLAPAMSAAPLLPADSIRPAQPTSASQAAGADIAGTVDAKPDSIPDRFVESVLSRPLTRSAADLVAALAGAARPRPIPAESGSDGPAAPNLVPPRLVAPTAAEMTALRQRQQDRLLQRRVEQFQNDVLLGNWLAVEKTLSRLDQASAERIYAHLIRSFNKAPAVNGASDQSLVNDQPVPIGAVAPVANAAMVPGDYLTPEDILSIANLSPKPLTRPQIASLGNMLRQSVSLGLSAESVVQRLIRGTRLLGGDELDRRVMAVQFLNDAGLANDAERLLPGFEQLDREHVGLMMVYGEHAQAMYQLHRKYEWLERSWNCFQSVVGNSAAGESDREAALEQLILLSTRVKKELGESWLQDVCAQGGETSWKMLALLGEKTLRGPWLNPQDPATRLKWLQLQQQAVTGLLGSDRPPASLDSVLSLLATAWLTEAQVAINLAPYSRGDAYMQIDIYGNYYWVNPNQMNANANRDQPRAIEFKELLATAPQTQWQADLDPQLAPAIPIMMARLHLKANQEDQAFPYIETIASSDPATARQLVGEFLDTWTKNHDPNNDRRMQNRYIYFYGFDVKADAIPLTRSKQQRNLQDLGKWVARIRMLPIEEIDEVRLAKAFTTCHSSAEVFQLESLRSVFGELDSLRPETVASICQTMRSNLATTWRSVREQEQLQTRRREPEIQQAVLRGYETARTFASSALERNPQDWHLLLVLACLAHDENDYQRDVQKSSEFSQRRDSAFELFAQAAQEYARVMISLDKSEQSTDVYDYWFYASLGAVDLGRITAETTTAPRQFERIRQAMQALPGENANQCLAEFANNLFTRMSPIKPELKYRYLKAGFEIIGDHPRAIEAKKLFDYYNDLIQEIQLVAEVDGGAIVGHQQPFGVYVNIQHTSEIERESAGFAKYVQNQNNQIYAYNYGRPTEDYRDKFEKNVQQALSEHFDILAMAFEDAKSMRSRPVGDGDWRVTPYAFLLLQAKGPQVDRLPSLQLDLDFLDTSGYAVIPVHSSIIPIDCSPDQTAPRPFSKLKVEQSLDERQAGDGKLILEVKATAQGLVPDLEQILDLKFPGFEIASIDRQPVLPTEFDPDSDTIVVNSDRSWRVELRAVDDSASGARQFHFATPRVPTESSIFQRFQDADLVAVSQTIDLERRLGGRWNLWWLWIGGPIAAGALILLLARWRRSTAQPQAAVELPQEINPFTVLMLLRRIRATARIRDDRLPQLTQSIDELERYYFSRSNGISPPDLEDIARHWVEQAR